MRSGLKPAKPVSKGLRRRLKTAGDDAPATKPVKKTAEVPAHVLEKQWRADMHKRWTDDLPTMIRRWCAAGLSDAEICSLIGIDMDVFYEWLSTHQEMFAAYVSGSQMQDTRVERALFAKAVGYTARERTGFSDDGRPIYTTKTYPPHFASLEMWMLNRAPDRWRKRVEYTGADGGPIKQIVLDPTKLASMNQKQLERLYKLLTSDNGFQALLSGGASMSMDSKTVDMDVSEYARLVGETI